MKGILLAGGSGTRLSPFTSYISKQLLPVYNKPMIMYPLSTLMMAGITEILIISSAQDIGNYEKLLGDGKELGISLSYAIQFSPNGIAEAFLIGRNFIGYSDVCLILGDNMFYSTGFRKILKDTVDYVRNTGNAVIFGQHVKDPHRFGVVEEDTDGSVISIEEKPINPKSSIASVGLYFYPNSVIKKALTLKPSERGELEITDINLLFLAENNLMLSKMHRAFMWFDMGIIDSLFECASFIKQVEQHSNYKIGLCEEIAYNEGYITLDQLHKTSHKYNKTDIAEYILGIK